MKNAEVRRRLRRLLDDVGEHGVVGETLMVSLVKKHFPSNLIGDL